MTKVQERRKLGHLTHVETIAISLVFDVMGEEQINRSADEYANIAEALPPLKVLHHFVNEELRKRLRSPEYANRKICRFKAGDRIIKFEPYPRTISIETIRSALNSSGMREPRRQRKASTH
jgi:hypothetical protein